MACSPVGKFGTGGPNRIIAGPHCANNDTGQRAIIGGRRNDLGDIGSSTMARTFADPILRLYEPGTTMPMTYEEYLALREEVLAEWVEGETIFLMTPKPPHAEAVSFLVTLLRLFVRRFNLGTVRAGPLEMLILGGTVSRVPDLL